MTSREDTMMLVKFSDKLIDLKEKLDIAIYALERYACPSCQSKSESGCLRNPACEALVKIKEETYG